MFTTQTERLRILLVEDDADTAQSMVMLLGMSGHSTCWAPNGSAALEQADEDYDVVLLDLGLPGVNGYQVAERLRLKEKRPFIVAITGFGDDAARLRSAEAGIDLHFLKPVDVDDLLGLLGRLNGIIHQRPLSATSAITTAVPSSQSRHREMRYWQPGESWAH
jgi:DNA-binding response OmpR family regulator